MWRPRFLCPDIPGVNTPASEWPATLRYGVAAVGVGLATLLNMWLVPYSYTTRFLLFYPVVVLAVWFGGFRPGLLATGLASIATNYFLLPPYGHFSLDRRSLVRTLLFAAVFGTICWLAEQARKQLRRQMTLTETIAATAAAALFQMDSKGRVTFANAGAEQMFGFGADELLGQVLHDQIHCKRPDGSELPRAKCALCHVLSTGETLRNHEDVFFRKDGTPVHVDCSNAPMIRRGKIVGAVLVVLDITERKRAEEALRSSEARFRTLREHVSRNMRVLSLLFRSNRSHSKMVDDLTLAGCLVWESSSASEVLHLCRHEHIDVVVVAPEVNDAEARELEQRQITFRLSPGETSSELIWKLSQVFPFASLTRAAQKSGPPQRGSAASGS